MNLQKIKYFLVGVLGSITIRSLFSTMSIKEIPDGYSLDLERQGKYAIYAFWHAHMLLPAYVGRNRNVKVLISQHRDGEYIAQIVQRLGYGVARGSTTRGGAKALLRMIKQIKEESISLAITPDGPKGPRFVAQSGAILLGQKTEYPIIPVMIYLEKYWALPSWDRFCIPKPFSKARIFYGNHIQVPSRLEKHEMEEYRVALENELIRLEHEIESIIKDV
ncbi:MAG: lysophospholipid acyltransferase family protein [Candidatus Scalindua sp.]|nr:lysophospholipid acyltransferase family protein [Candidatus Scalindua sp.]MDV5167025.1 lysophospholipid acyltransferase family protein [Candidatus Scalindua sp.]